jgi:hypothetical protein
MLFSIMDANSVSNAFAASFAFWFDAVWVVPKDGVMAFEPEEILLLIGFIVYVLVGHSMSKHGAK